MAPRRTEAEMPGRRPAPNDPASFFIGCFNARNGRAVHTAAPFRPRAAAVSRQRKYDRVAALQSSRE